MDKRIEALINDTRARFGLDGYFLKRHQLYRRVNLFHETIYSLSMEWFPNHEVNHDGDYNPEGTASIEMEIDSKKYSSVIFVEGKTFANGVSFQDYSTDDIIKWVEQETGLQYHKQFLIHKEDEGNLQFSECIDGIPLSSGYITVQFDEQARLTMFTSNIVAPTEEVIEREEYTLTIEQMEDLVMKQLKLIHYPSFEQEKLIPVYGIEEIFIRNDVSSTIPFELNMDANSYLPVEETMYWEEPIHGKSMERRELNWEEVINPEDAFHQVPSPDSKPITEEQVKKSIHLIRDFLSVEYKNDSGMWVVKTLHRDKGYIHAILRMNKDSGTIFQRKLLIIIDPDDFTVVNYLDNEAMLGMFAHFEKTVGKILTRELAYKKLKAYLQLDPRYVFDANQRKFVLCGKLDCQYAVHAISGEIDSLSTIR
ncbi:hypothetical protein [Ornithinibacillus scapharcae]|uniref:hypothetical protein n=1 Tax=Ornithinibacillus scapharcae TaxID=1147159 RepID=UPI000225BD28|nr:hypothetical protein [Ornithinibacillus scapharcae]